MWRIFFFENFHFSINLFAALVIFAVSWLYVDAWKLKKNTYSGLASFGFFMLSLSFVVHSARLETSFFDPQNYYKFSIWGETILKFVGYISILASQLSEKLQKTPSAAAIIVGNIISYFYPVFAFLISGLYYRRASRGLEVHLKPVSVAFFFLGVYEALSLRSFWTTSDNVNIYSLTQPFNYIWILEHLFLTVGIIFLARWVFGYLLKQFQTQLFMIMSSLILAIFLVTTIVFTSLLLRNIEDQTLSNLENDVKVLNLAIDSKKQEVLANAETISQNTEFIDALKNGDQNKLAQLSKDTLLNQKNDFLVIVNASGQVVARGEDSENIGDSLQGDSVVSRVLRGEPSSSVTIKEGAIFPDVSIRASGAIKNDAEIIGSVILGRKIDNPFVDGLKKATGLEASVYGDNILSATTLLSPDGKSKLSGITENNARVKTEVLLAGKTESASIKIAGTEYFASFHPLLDVNQNPVGMLFVGTPQVGIFALAAKSIEFTFIVSAVLMVLSIFPSIMISKYLAKQL